MMAKRSEIIQRIKNVFTGYDPGLGANLVPADSKQAARNLSRIISPVQLTRLRTDVSMWRDSISEAELAWYPHRVKMQRMFIDTILNGHVDALWERRKDLTMLRDFVICDDKEKEDEDWTKYFEDQDWFNLLLNYILDAIAFGYSLISLGDIENSAFPKLSLVRRWNVSPDRLNVSTVVYGLAGPKFTERPYSDWHIWVPTPTQTGYGSCGFGLLYKVGLYEILIRNNLTWNADFTEVFAQPYRVGKTTKTTESERADLEAALRDIGANGYAIMDPSDTIEFLEANLGSEGYKSYESLEKRCIATISEMILGHADAITSVPGRLGTGGNKEDNPVTIAMLNKQSRDGRFVETVINTQLLPIMRSHGFSIPEELHFAFKNDEEKEALRKREDESNLATANLFNTITQAGGDPDWDYFTERTGIKVTKAADPAPPKPEPFNKPGKPDKLEMKTRAIKMKNLYAKPGKKDGTDKGKI